MRNYLILSLFVLASLGCKNRGTEDRAELVPTSVSQEEFSSFGRKISPQNALSATEVGEQIKSLKPGDTLAVKFRTKVVGVCKMKGCWMTLDLPNIEKDPMVKFKDYGFFVPKDIEGREVIVEGIAFMEETSIEDLKHLAGDAGKSQEEIDAISLPERSPAFLAEGVLIKE